VAVTPAGQELYSRALTIVKQLEAAQTAVRELDRGVCGTVNVGLLRTATRRIAPALFDALRTEYPMIVAQVRVGYSADLAALLKAGKLDVAMQVRSGQSIGQRAAVLYSERLCLVGPPGLVPDVPALTVDQLHGIPLLLSSMQPSYSTLVRAAAAQGVGLSVLGGIEDDSAVLQVCESGAAATILPETTAAIEIRGRGLRLAVVEDPALQREILLSTNPDIPSTGAILAVENVLRRLLIALHSTA
jgi:DNA-binding transcriptional LysR family regulator